LENLKKGGFRDLYEKNERADDGYEIAYVFYSFNNLHNISSSHFNCRSNRHGFSGFNDNNNISANSIYTSNCISCLVVHIKLWGVKYAIFKEALWKQEEMEEV